MASVHFLHARFIDLCAFINSPLGGILLMLLFKLFQQNLLLLFHYLRLFLFELLEPHDQSFEGPLMRLLQHEVLDCWI
jgi:hypothetical protein